MDKNSSRESDLVLDLENGMNSTVKEEDGAKDKGALSRVRSGFVGIDGSMEGEVQKPKKKGCKKPPKPPRPPNSPPLDAANQKLMKEISEIAILKRARIERMKKKMKNANSTYSNSNLWALIISILFILVLIWQGVLCRGSSSVSFHGSPESSVRTRGGLISIQFYKNASRNYPQTSSSASPNNVVPISG